LSIVTADIVKRAKMARTICLDGLGFWEQHFRCVEFPELYRIDRGPRGRSKEARTTRFLVGEDEVARDAQAIATAINKYRADGELLYARDRAAP
jgi:hypothetical protein